jgi:hypothetical protein
MCAYSMVGDYYREMLPQRDYWPNVQPWVGGGAGAGGVAGALNPFGPSKADFDALKRDVEEMKQLLKRAIEYDKRTGQPDCESADKVAFIRKIADLAGVDLDDLKQ